jgi:AmmeMemoRadiSam system protein A
MKEKGKPEQKHSPLVALAKEAVESYIKTGKVIKPGLSAKEIDERAGVFVSIKKKGALRGCIGTFEPTKKNIADEVISNAISSATHDYRFAPIQASELDDLEYSVDVLTHPEAVSDVSELDPKKHGVIVQCGYRRGLLLPDLEGVDTVEQQIEICRAKGGITEEEPIKLYRFQVRRYK